MSLWQQTLSGIQFDTEGRRWARPQPASPRAGEEGTARRNELHVCLLRLLRLFCFFAAFGLQKCKQGKHRAQTSSSVVVWPAT